MEGDDFLVDSDIATSVALVINELLQNSPKYAFTGRKGRNHPYYRDIRGASIPRFKSLITAVVSRCARMMPSI